MYKKRLIFLAILFVANVFVWYAISVEARSGKLTVAFLDVGQGDAVFVEGPSGTQVLIDGGQGRAVLRELGAVMPFYDRSIDVLIATHPDADHIGGLPDVLENFDIDFVFEPGIAHDTGTYEEFMRLIGEENAKHLIARRGQVINLGDEAYLRILFPDRDVSGVEPNAGSVFAQIVYGETEVMLTGDAPKSIEQYVISLDGPTLESNVLKAGHHGSKTSSDESFVGLVDPDYVVISAGENNRYGHPHEEILDVFEQFETKILGTYAEGRIVFELDGETLMRIK